MEIIKNNVIVKALLFVLLQICMVSLILNSMIVIYNVGYGWYSANENQVKEVIIDEVAENTAFFISNQAGYNDWTHPYGFLEDVYDAEGFAYEVLTTNNERIHAVNLQLINDKNVYRISDTYNVYDEDKGRYYDVIINTYWIDPMNMSSNISLGYSKGMESMYKIRCFAFENRYLSVWLTAGTLIASILLIIVLVKSIRKETNTKSIINKMPADIVFLLCIGVIAVIFMMAGECWFNYYNRYQSYDVLIALTILIVLLLSILVTGYVLLISALIKRRMLIRGTFIYKTGKLSIKIFNWCIQTAKRIIKIIPMVWRTVLLLLVVVFINLIISVNIYWSGFALLCWILGALAISALVIYTVLCMKRLKEGGEKIAAGNLDYKINKKGLFLDFVDHAEHLNMIGDGMAAAVEERIKSERFKAELITNVSHDIKTPLTSIINYVDLLKKENIEDEKINEYIEVLDRQSMRLKKLAEDIVDASKASTGNVKFDITPCKVGLLISQTIAEYKEKTEAHELDVIMKLPEEELEVLADGRRMWRVFDNLLNNICKYSQPGTRVYVSLESKDGKAVITYRNVSKYELDISEEELMERFVRGDKSRNTEGSGLGLSIARNLVELQDGSFDINIDGDLFKVTIEFSLINL